MMLPSRRIAIAIDGPSASGKSTTAREVAGRLGYLYVDTGAMYRALAKKVLAEQLNTEDSEALDAFLERTAVECLVRDGSFRVLLDGVDVTVELRGTDVSRKASQVATVPAIRRWMVAKQREMANRAQGIVMEGRDIGTVVLPEADLKIYLVASSGERARRRWKEQVEAGSVRTPRDVETEIEERDRRDMTRKHSPLEKAADAIEIDTTELRVEDQVRLVLEEVKKIGAQSGPAGN